MPLTGLRQQPFQLRDRAPVAGLDLERFAQRTDRAIEIVQVLLVELGAPAQEGQLRARVDRPSGLLVDQLAQLLPGAPALQRPLVELRHLAVVGARIEEPAVVLLRLGALSQLVIEDLGGPADDVEDGRLLAELTLEVTGQQAGRVLPAIELAGEAQELLAAQALGRRLLKHLAVPAQRALVVLELLLEEARDPLRPGEPLGRLLHLQEPDLPILISEGQSARPA